MEAETAQPWLFGPVSQHVPLGAPRGHHSVWEAVTEEEAVCRPARSSLSSSWPHRPFPTRFLPVLPSRGEPSPGIWPGHVTCLDQWNQKCQPGAVETSGLEQMLRRLPCLPCRGRQHMEASHGVGTLSGWSFCSDSYLECLLLLRVLRCDLPARESGPQKAWV